MAYNDSTGDVWREAVRRTRHVYDGESVRDAKIVIDYLIAEVCILLEEMEHEKMIPRIPEGCERFRQDDIDRWEFQFPGCGDDAEWDLVESILLLSGPTPESRLLWRDLCNAARCAWLDEAEKTKIPKCFLPKTNLIHFVLFQSGLKMWACYPKCSENEIEHAWAQAWADEWARRAKR